MLANTLGRYLAGATTAVQLVKAGEGRLRVKRFAKILGSVGQLLK